MRNATAGVEQKVRSLPSGVRTGLSVTNTHHRSNVSAGLQSFTRLLRLLLRIARMGMTSKITRGSSRLVNQWGRAPDIFERASDALSKALQVAHHSRPYSRCHSCNVVAGLPLLFICEVCGCPFSKQCLRLAGIDIGRRRRINSILSFRIGLCMSCDTFMEKLMDRVDGFWH